jgi:hypothetical protein
MLSGKSTTSIQLPTRQFNRTPSLDVGAARKYLAGLENMAREARETDDPRVLVTALAVISQQTANIDFLVRP